LEFLVEFDINGPDGTPGTEVADRQTAEASAAAKLAGDGHPTHAWKPPVAPAACRVLSPYRPVRETELNNLRQALSLYDLDEHHGHPPRADPAPVAR